jgi:hypothetical protein
VGSQDEQKIWLNYWFEQLLATFVTEDTFSDLLPELLLLLPVAPVLAALDPVLPVDAALPAPSLPLMRTSSPTCFASSESLPVRL